jgi:selenocysteine-specific elongation factor
VAGGRVLDIFPPTRHKRSAERLALLAAMRDDDPAAGAGAARRAVAGRRRSGALCHQLESRRRRADALWPRAGLRVVAMAMRGSALPRARWDALGAALLDALAREHERAPDLAGVERERLRRMTSANLPRAAFDVLVGELLAAGEAGADPRLAAPCRSTSQRFGGRPRPVRGA